MKKVGQQYKTNWKFDQIWPQPPSWKFPCPPLDSLFEEERWKILKKMHKFLFPNKCFSLDFFFRFFYLLNYCSGRDREKLLGLHNFTTIQVRQFFFAENIFLIFGRKVFFLFFSINTFKFSTTDVWKIIIFFKVPSYA